MRLELNDKGNYAQDVFLVPPQIHNLHPMNGSITVRSGSRVRLECRASGQPKPAVYWNRHYYLEVLKQSLNTVDNILHTNLYVTLKHK